MYELPSTMPRQTVLQNWKDKGTERICQGSYSACKKCLLEHLSSRCQTIDQLFWKPSEDASQWKVIWESNVTPNLSRSLDSFSTVPKIVNGSDCGCTVPDIETKIVLVLLTFNFIPHRSSYSLTLLHIKSISLKL